MAIHHLCQQAATIHTVQMANQVSTRFLNFQLLFKVMYTKNEPKKLFYIPFSLLLLSIIKIILREAANNFHHSHGKKYKIKYENISAKIIINVLLLGCQPGQLINSSYIKSNYKQFEWRLACDYGCLNFYQDSYSNTVFSLYNVKFMAYETS